MKLTKDFGVRALMGVLVVIPTVSTLCYLAVRGSSEALVAIAAMSTGIIGYYFGQRNKT